MTQENKKIVLLPFERDYTDEMESVGPEESKKKNSIEIRKNGPKVKIRDFSKDIEGVEEEKFNVVKASKKRKAKIKIRDYSDEDHSVS